MNAYELADYLLKHGEGCECSAYSSYECACDAIWGENYTTQASTMLRQQAKRIEELEKELKCYKSMDKLVRGERCDPICRPSVCDCTKIKELSDEEIQEIADNVCYLFDKDKKGRTKGVMYIEDFARAIIKASRGES